MKKLGKSLYIGDATSMSKVSESVEEIKITAIIIIIIIPIIPIIIIIMYLSSCTVYLCVLKYFYLNEIFWFRGYSIRKSLCL